MIKDKLVSALIGALVACLVLFGYSSYRANTLGSGSGQDQYFPQTFLDTVTFSGTVSGTATTTLSGTVTLSGAKTLSGSTTTLSGSNILSNSTSTGLVIRNASGTCYLIGLTGVGVLTTSTATCN